MQPIEQRTDLNFLQALRCVEYRLPMPHTLKHAGRLHSLALRYGLIGAAATHQLLLSVNDDEEMALMDAVANWPLAVEEHFCWNVLPRMGLITPSFLPANLGNHAYFPIVTYLEHYRRLAPLEHCLKMAAQKYIDENYEEIRSGWNWFQQARPVKEFRALANDSLRFAELFFERRQLGLDEVPEIALLGE